MWSNKGDIEKENDRNCRLRHGLNVHCLVEIFQHLNSVDLYKLGAMNEFYRQIIHEYVISKHNIDFELLKIYGISVQNILNRYASRVRKFHFDGERERDIAKFIQLVTQHCSADQFTDVHFSYHYDIDIVKSNIIDIHLPAQFGKVEKFHFCGPFYDFRLEIRLYMPVSHSLQHIKLEDVILHPNIDWIEAVNLTHIHLDAVIGLNVPSFIAYLRRRPKLEYFYQKKTFGVSMQAVGEAMAEYCGEHIRVYRNLEYDLSDRSPPHFLQFLSGFKNVNECWLSTRQICAGDLLAPIHRLADTKVEKLVIICYDNYDGPDINCIFMDEIIQRSWYLNRLNHLKTIRIDVYDGFDTHMDVCEQMKVLTMYSSEILSNVENVFLIGGQNMAYDYEFIKSVPKLRLLVIDSCEATPTSEQAAKLIAILKSILQNRADDFIELKIKEYHLKTFQDVDDIGSSIILTGIIHFREILSNYFTE